jgi:hypothetical protein
MILPLSRDALLEAHGPRASWSSLTLSCRLVGHRILGARDTMDICAMGYHHLGNRSQGVLKQQLWLGSCFQWERLRYPRLFINNGLVVLSDMMQRSYLVGFMIEGQNKMQS